MIISDTITGHQLTI